MNTKQAFAHLKKMSGRLDRLSVPSTTDPLKFASDLNLFYNRFDSHDFSIECESLLAAGPLPVPGDIDISTVDVTNQFKKCKANKAPGPDGIPGRLLKECAIELGPVFQPLFKQSVDIGVIPTIWKTSVVVPVPKMSSPSELNHFRPVALTSIVIKCFERLILSHILPHVQSQLDPYQFAYRSRRGTDDAIACLIHKLFEHMETAGNYARILFIDFSSAFNTIQRHVMIDKLQKLEVPAALVHWVFNFLSNRPQCVRVDDIKSPVLVSNTGAPQGCVLSQFVYTLYTNDCRSVDSSTQFVRFSDDTAMLALLNDFASYQSYLSSVVRFSSWCSKKILHLNVSKTKEMCIDFRRNRTVISPIVINGEPVEQVDSFKYLGVILDEKLSFTEHVTAVQKKSQQRLHVLRKLRAFYVDPLHLLRLYRSITEPLLTYCSICYYPALSVKNRNRLLKISHVSAKTIGLPTPKLTEIIDHAILKKTRAVATESDHPLSMFFHVLPSQRRYRCIKCKTCRYSRSFVPVAIGMLNAK